jgi:hypothetical protein
MARKDKRAEREARCQAYRALCKELAEHGIYTPSATSIFEVLGKARLSESYASSTKLSRDDLVQHSAEAVVPEELSDNAISDHLVHAARLYATAASKCAVIPDPRRAFKYFRRAAGLLRRAAGLRSPPDQEAAEGACRCREKAAMARAVVAKRRSCRRRWRCLLVGRW